MKLIIPPLLCIMAFPVIAHEQDGSYFEEGKRIVDEYILSTSVDGIFYSIDAKDGDIYRLMVISAWIYVEDDEWKFGGYYLGDLTVPSEVNGFDTFDNVFKVTSVAGLYKNGLTSLTLPETIESVGSIESCRHIRKVQLNNSLKALYGVKDCPNLTDCPLPLCLERIDYGGMSGIAISETDFPQPLTTIGKGVFCDNQYLKRVSLGNLEEMGDSCFCHLPVLKEITIPETLQSLSEGSFFDCKSLEKVTLPESPVLSEGTFNNCPAIKEVTVYATTPYLFPTNCMADTDKKQCTLYVPEGSEQLYADADGWKEFGKISPVKKTNLNSVSTDGEWRAMSSWGKLLVDSTMESVITIHNTAGQLISTVTQKGRTELNLPKGIYIVSSHGKSIKVKI